MIEMMIAITISATLLTAALAALDTMFKGYSQTTESASTHVVSRIVMSRLQGMIRTGSEFGPIPVDVLNENQNPLGADFFEFVGRRDTVGNPLELVRIEYRDSAGTAPMRTWAPPSAGPATAAPGPGELWFVLLDATQVPPVVVQQHPLISGVLNATFTMQYEIGPKLKQATIDLLIQPNDSQDLTIGTDIQAPTIRLVASGAPRSGVE